MVDKREMVSRMPKLSNSSRTLHVCNCFANDVLQMLSCKFDSSIVVHQHGSKGEHCFMGPNEPHINMVVQQQYVCNAGPNT